MRILKAKDTGKNWYGETNVIVNGRGYKIYDVEWKALERYWILNVSDKGYKVS